MDTVSLACRSLGGEASAPPLVLLHGMLGSSRNWQTSGRKLAESFRVTALDLRNHGESPHHEVMDYPSMAADVLRWLDGRELERVHLVGHSMGGKVSMYLACRYPERVASLTVVDIAPRAVPPRWEKEFTLMREMPIGDFQRRSEAEAWLEGEIRDWAFRKFLVSNLERDDDGNFRWIINLEILHQALPNLFQQVPADGQRFEGPVLFIKGEKSRFIQDDDREMILHFFPFARLETVAEAGHNVHFDQPDAFVRLISNFIERPGQ